jgi:hypothetical protein
MQQSAQEIESLSRERVRLGMWLVFSFLAVLGGIAANDALVHAGREHSAMRGAALLVTALSGIVMAALAGRLIVLLRRSFNEPRLRRTLWDELASANHSQSMVFAYFAMLMVLLVLAVVSMFTTLSAPWVVNGLLVTAFAAQAGSFAWLERRGGDAGN